MQTTRRTLLATGASLAGVLAMPSVLRAASGPKLVFSYPWQTYTKMYAELAQVFTAKNPGIEVEFVAGGDNWDTLLQNTFRASVVNDLPDGTWQSLTFAPILARRKIAQPLNAFSGGTEQMERMGFSRPLIEATLVDGDSYSLPFGTTIPVTFYNMDLLEHAGYTSSELPQTWEQIIDVALKVAALGGGVNGATIAYDSTNAWMFQNVLASLGGRMMDQAQKDIAFDGKEGLQSLEILSKYGKATTYDMNQNQSRQAFISGATGVDIRSASGVNAMAKEAAGRFEFRVGAFPVSAPNGRLIGAGHGFFMFAKDPARQKRVWEFLRFAGGADGQAILAKHTGYMPINMLTLNDPKFLETYYKANPYHHPVVERLPITGDQFSFPSDNTVKITDMMVDEMRKVVTQQSNAKDALGRMAEQTRKLLKA